MTAQVRKRDEQLSWFYGLSHVHIEAFEEGAGAVLVARERRQRDGGNVRFLFAWQGPYGAVAAPGSRLGVDVIGASFLESPWTAPLLRRLDEPGIGWHFGTDEPERLFEQWGWDATATIVGEPESNWGRWPYPVPSRSMPGFPKSYFVRATRRAP